METASSLRDWIEQILPRVARPARYAGGEINSITKSPDHVSVRFALAFPDIYEIGMSNLGLRILYEVLNSQPDVGAERVFAPAPDMEREMRRAGLPLFSLESSLPVRTFDVVGFSLAYELTYPSVLNMLDLAGVPLLSQDRKPDDPIIIAGGHCTVNPEPMSDFIDAFVIGDGEEAIVEIADVVRHHNGKRQAILRGLADLEGLYVPAIHDADVRVRARSVRDLERAVFPLKPVVPFVESVHDRGMLEIMRGCTRGCRFCQAGMITRPVRERSLAKLCEQAEAIISTTGYDEIALTSLSSADYSQVEELTRVLLDRHGARRVGISLPSLRPDASCVMLADQIQRVRKTGLTFAPEAGTQRLRNVINKNVTELDLLAAVEAAVRSGWRRVKLYFMIGLPTETDEDIDAIGDLVHRVLRVGRENGVRLEVGVTVSPFVPKPHTPFQWRGMCPMEKLHDRISKLRHLLRSKSIRLSWHEPSCSQVEAALARGDRAVGKVIYQAWRLGCNLEQENFDASRWHDAFRTAGVDLEFYAHREIPTTETLPWDRIDVGVTRDFLIKENEKADRGEVTPDCRITGCVGCGIGRTFEKCPPPSPKGELKAPSAEKKQFDEISASRRALFRFEKGLAARWLGHLDLMRVFERAIRASEVNIAYSEGFNPRPKMSVSAALPVGATGSNEVLILTLKEPVDLKTTVARLNAVLPQGVAITEGQLLPEGLSPPTAEASQFEIDLRLPNGVEVSDLEAVVGNILARNAITFGRELESGRKLIDLRPGIKELSVVGIQPDNTVRVRVLLPHAEFTVKPSEIFELVREAITGLELARVHRSELRIRGKTSRVRPLTSKQKGGEKTCPRR